jgi:hypothetical protein
MRAKVLFTQSVTNVYLNLRPAHKFWNQIIFVCEYTVYSVQCIVYSVQFTVYSVQYTVYNIQYTVLSVQYTA